jgi:hypothetical protein
MLLQSIHTPLHFQSGPIDLPGAPNTHIPFLCCPQTDTFTKNQKGEAAIVKYYHHDIAVWHQHTFHAPLTDKNDMIELPGGVKVVTGIFAGVWGGGTCTTSRTNPL